MFHLQGTALPKRSFCAVAHPRQATPQLGIVCKPSLSRACADSGGSQLRAEGQKGPPSSAAAAQDTPQAGPRRASQKQAVQPLLGKRPAGDTQTSSSALQEAEAHGVPNGRPALQLGGILLDLLIWCRVMPTCRPHAQAEPQSSGSAGIRLRLQSCQEARVRSGRRICPTLADGSAAMVCTPGQA